jgi:tetratricopeptide (TPR) repeat protein
MKSPIAKQSIQPILWAAGVFIVSVLLYSNTLGHQFVWDDVRLIEENHRIRQLDSESVEDAFSTHYLVAVQPRGSLYRPLSTLSFQLDYRWHGADASGFHLTNVILNALHCVLVFVFVLLLFRSLSLAVAAALLYAALPLHTENVAWVAGRTDLLSAVWMTFSLICYVMWRRREHYAWLSACALSYAMGLLSKEIALAVVLMLLFIELTPARRLIAAEDERHTQRRAIVSALAILVVISVGYLALRHAVIGGFNPAYSDPVRGVGSKAALALSTVAGYVSKILYPFNLNAEYEVPIPSGIAGVYPLVGVAVLSALGYAGWRFRSRPVVTVGLAIFFITLLPVLNVIPIAETAAERFLYYPTLGSCLVLAGIFAPALSKARRERAVTDWILAAVFVVLVVSYSAQTYSRNAVWKSEETLFATTVTEAGESARAHLNLGNTYYKNGNLIAAIEEYQKALAIDPRLAGAWSSLSGAYIRTGRTEKGLETIERALAIEPNNANFLSSRGTIYSRLERFDEAASSFEAAIRVQPDHSDARFNYALSEYLRGAYDKSIALFALVPRKDTDYVRAYYYLAVMEAEKNNVETARGHAERFLSLYTRHDALRTRAQAILEQ